MKGRKSARSRRRGGRRGPRGAGGGKCVCSTIVSSIATIGPNVQTLKVWKYSDLMPDVNTTRAIVIDRLEVDMAVVGTLVNAMSVNAYLVGIPFSAAQNVPGVTRFTQNEMVTVGSGLKHVFVIRPDHPGQLVPVEAGSGNTLLQMEAYSQISATAQLTIRVFYRYDADTVVSVVA